MAVVAPSTAAQGLTPTLPFESDEFADGEVVPQRYTCDGTNTAPPLKWRGVPDETAELVLLLEDPDAGDETFVHWMVAGLDPNLPELPEGFVPETAKVGLNDHGSGDYRGPCPSHGDDHHRFVFTLLAVREPTLLDARFTAQELADVLTDNVLAVGQLVARYGRTGLGV